MYLCGPSWAREITALIFDFILLFCQPLTSAFSRSLSWLCVAALLQQTQAVLRGGQVCLVVCTIPQCPFMHGKKA